MRPGLSILYPELQSTIRKLPDPSHGDPTPGPIIGLSHWIAGRQQRGEFIPVVFICTHNSRRSVIAQSWMAALATAYGLDGVLSFSGGTEETAVAPPALRALSRAGFRVDPATGENPRYRVMFSDRREGLSLYSKRYQDPANPSEGFAAVLLCDSADVGCPVVHGASARFFLPFPDPKASDGSPLEGSAYEDTSRSLAVALDRALYLSQRDDRTT